MASGEMSSPQFRTFLTTSLQYLATYSINGAIAFVCMDWRHMGEVLAAGKAAFTELKNLCVRTKTNGGMGSLYRSQHELVFVFKNGTERRVTSTMLNWGASAATEQTSGHMLA